MIVLLVTGIACLALCALQLTRPRRDAERDRRAALASVRSTAGAGSGAAPAKRRSVLLGRISTLLVRVHVKLWRRQSPDDIAAQLRRAGSSRRLTPEVFMAGRVVLTVLGVLAGLTLADGGRAIVLALFFGFAAVYLPWFLLSKSAAQRADRIDGELPHFVDQLAIAIEAGMSFDAALSYLVDASDGPLSEEIGRVMAELRVGESRRAAMRSFGERVAARTRSRSRTLSSPPSSSGRRSPASCAPRRPTSATGAR